MGKISDSIHCELVLCSTNLFEPLHSLYEITICASLFTAQTIVFKSKRIPLDLDCTVAPPSWCEIDAVKIAGNLCMLYIHFH